jgi:hypothetical protein
MILLLNNIRLFLPSLFISSLQIDNSAYMIKEQPGDNGSSDETSGGEMDPELWLKIDAKELGKKRSACVDCGRDVAGPGFHHCHKCWTVSFIFVQLSTIIFDQCSLGIRRVRLRKFER